MLVFFLDPGFVAFELGNVMNIISMHTSCNARFKGRYSLVTEPVGATIEDAVSGREGVLSASALPLKKSGSIWSSWCR